MTLEGLLKSPPKDRAVPLILKPSTASSLLDDAPDKAMNFSLDTILYRLTNTENRLVVARVRQGEMDWEFGTNSYKCLDRE